MSNSLRMDFRKRLTQEEGLGIATSVGRKFLKTNKMPRRKAGDKRGLWKEIGVLAIYSLRGDGIKNPTVAQLKRRIGEMASELSNLRQNLRKE